MTNETSNANEPSVIVQLPRDSAIDHELHAYPLPSVASGRVVLDHVPPGADGRLEPPEASEIVMSVPSPEGLRQPSEVRTSSSSSPAEASKRLTAPPRGSRPPRNCARRSWPWSCTRRARAPPGHHPEVMARRFSRQAAEPATRGQQAVQQLRRSTLPSGPAAVAQVALPAHGERLQGRGRWRSERRSAWR